MTLLVGEMLGSLVTDVGYGDSKGTGAWLLVDVGLSVGSGVSGNPSGNKESKGWIRRFCLVECFEESLNAFFIRKQEVIRIHLQ
jgi:hypothetical protein